MLIGFKTKKRVGGQTNLVPYQTVTPFFEPTAVYHPILEPLVGVRQVGALDGNHQ
jgi:hypothetical protein